jgi:peptide/nickel transport system substrate-binding protein
MTAMKRTAFAAAGLAAFLCSAGAVTAGPADNTLRWASDSEAANINPYYNNVREGVIHGFHIYDAPTYRDPATGEYRPHLAESVRLVDETTIEIVMREGVVAHNGETVDARDVVATVAFVSNPANRATAHNRFAWLAGADLVDNRTVRLRMARPFGPWQEYLTTLLILPDEHLAQAGVDGIAREPVGTGPYRVAELSPGRQTVLQRFDRYFGGAKGQPSIDRLVFRRMPERNTQIAELMTGGLDWIWRVQPDQARSLRGRRNITVVSGGTIRFHYVSFDAAGRTGRENNPMTDLRVRQAINHAVNRESLLRNLVGEGSEVLHVPCHPEQFGCDARVATRYAYDPARARALLAEAGFPQGFEVTLSAYRERPWAEAIIGDLRAVGIRAQLRWLQADSFQTETRQNRMQMGFGSWGSSSLYDMAASTSYFFRNTPDDMARDEEVVRLLERGDTSTNPDTRREAYAAALRRITEQAYWMPVVTFPLTFAHHSQLEFTPSADEVPRFFAARWRR